MDSKVNNVKNKPYVAWQIDLDSNFCNCSNDNKIGTGIESAFVKFFHSDKSALAYSDYLKEKNSNLAVFIKLNNSESTIIKGFTKFINKFELIGFFKGYIVGENLKYCKTACN